jgi:hypothetical protein
MELKSGGPSFTGLPPVLKPSKRYAYRLLTNAPEFPKFLVETAIRSSYILVATVHHD